MFLPLLENWYISVSFGPHSVLHLPPRSTVSYLHVFSPISAPSPLYVLPFKFYTQVSSSLLSSPHTPPLPLAQPHPSPHLQHEGLNPTSPYHIPNPHLCRRCPTPSRRTFQAHRPNPRPMVRSERLHRAASHRSRHVLRQRRPRHRRRQVRTSGLPRSQLPRCCPRYAKATTTPLRAIHAQKPTVISLQLLCHASEHHQQSRAAVSHTDCGQDYRQGS